MLEVGGRGIELLLDSLVIHILIREGQLAVLLCLSSLSAPDVYYGIYEKGQDRCIIYFDAPERAVGLLKKTNSGAFRASDKRMKALQQNRKESEQ